MLHHHRRSVAVRLVRLSIGLAVAVGLVVPAIAAPASASGPRIDTFAPTQGAVGTTVRISGGGLGGTTKVTFNGVDAAFSVESGSLITATVPVGVSSGPISAFTHGAAVSTTSSFKVIPIQHVVVIYEENHTFDNILGLFCAERPERGCDGATEGTRSSDGRVMQLVAAPDIVPSIAHDPTSQAAAIDNGRMDGFDTIRGCTAIAGFRCYSQHNQAETPDLWTLAQHFALSDRTFSQSPVASWGAHLELVSTTLDGFLGFNPHAAPDHSAAAGWGCDSFRDSEWTSPLGDVSPEPSCVPAPDGTGPYRPSPVPWVPTIMDRLDAAGRTWRIYAAGPSGNQTLGYGWAICPSFADCLNTPQRANMVPFSQVTSDAADGTLPSVSLVLPNTRRSQHNGDSMIAGDNWIASVVNAVESGPDWSSTAVFITYDDCGCFYDHVPPPPGLGPRVPMVIVSPFARAGYTDSSVAGFVSMLAFIEHVFGLEPLSTRDAEAYDYADSFDFTQAPLAPIPLAHHSVPISSTTYLRTHPQAPEAT